MAMDGVINLANYRRHRRITYRHRPPMVRSLTMSTQELEELVSTIRQFIQKARNRDDAFEYCRLCDELKFAQAALEECDQVRQATPAIKSTSQLLLA